MNEFIYYCSLLYRFLGKIDFLFLFNKYANKVYINEISQLSCLSCKAIARFDTLLGYILLKKKYQMGVDSGNAKIVKK